MFAIGFVTGLILCIPASMVNESLALQAGWNSSATWPLLSGAAIVTLIVVLWTHAWSPEKYERWAGLLLGSLVGSGVVWSLHLFGR